jgi:pimeloyl-ACP methyl ester carboxylesterase
LFWLNRHSQFNQEIEMKLSQLYRSALIASTMLILSSALNIRGFAQTNSPQGTKNIVLVHGAWADGSCWSKVITLLQAKGFQVIAVQNPLTSLAADVAATKRIIALQDGPVILVGHSYAGVVITEAGNDPKVVGLVYVAAFAPGDGESINSVSKPYSPAPLGSELRPDAQGFLTATPKGIAEDMAQDLPASEQQILTATQGQTSSSIHVKPADIKLMAVSHSQPDHAGNMEMFPNTLMLVQKIEYEWAGSHCKPHMFDRGQSASRAARSRSCAYSCYRLPN